MRHLYIHIPFCKRRCSYCDFAVAVRKTVPGDAFVETIRREYELVVASGRIDRGPDQLDTVYLGGGTPSLLSARHLAELLTFVRDVSGLRPGAEVTLEANPDDVTEANAAAWRTAGITRVSVGVQSLDPETLVWMRRPHGAGDGVNAVRTLHTVGFESVSIDLIFGLPPDAGRGADPVGDLARLLETEPEHVSAYGLTAEPATPYGRWVERGAVRVRPADEYADEFARVHELLEGAGYEHYEVSNFARSGHRSRHNEAYWARRPYLGLGPSAHSFQADRRWWNERHWGPYRRRIETGQDPMAAWEQLSEDQVMLERIYLGLRKVEGIPEEDGPFSAWFLDRALQEGWLRREGASIRPTVEGWLRLDELAAGLTTSTVGG